MSEKLTLDVDAVGRGKPRVIVRDKSGAVIATDRCDVDCAAEREKGAKRLCKALKGKGLERTPAELAELLDRVSCRLAERREQEAAAAAAAKALAPEPAAAAGDPDPEADSLRSSRRRPGRSGPRPRTCCATRTSSTG
jgi:hypothetical protein